MELQDHWILAQDTTSETSVIQEPFPLTWVECHAISWQGFTDWVHWESHGSPVPCLLFSRSVVSVSLQPHGLKHARLPCPSLSPKVCSNSCPLNWWCHPTISSSVTRFSCPQSFPASESFPMSQLFTSGGQSIRVWASASVLPMNIQDWFPKIDRFDFLAVHGTLKNLFQHHSSKASIIWCSAFSMAQLSHPYVIPGKTIALTIQTFRRQSDVFVF